MARADSMRAENRRRWRERGGGGAALAAVAAAWLSARHRAALGGSRLDDGAPRWGVTARRWFGVKGLPPPPRVTGRLVRTHLGKESAASPHFATLLPCAALHAAPPQLLLISVWRMLLRAGQQRLVADARRWRQAWRLGQSGWLTVHPAWCWVCGAVVGRRFSVALFAGLACLSLAV